MNNKNFESGRSMVEMLGVLAVMGVLSVSGIAGYNTAMNKYKANELLNEASMRAVVVATHLASGRGISDSTLFGFGNSDTFTKVEPVGTTQFKLTLSGVDKGVCDQLTNILGNNGIIQEVGENCSYLILNNDLSRKSSSSASSSDSSNSSNTGTESGENTSSGNEQQEPETSTDLCKNYDAQCCDNGDITGTGACDYNGGTNSGLCQNGHCVKNPCNNYSINETVFFCEITTYPFEWPDPKDPNSPDVISVDINGDEDTINGTYVKYDGRYIREDDEPL